MFLCPHCGSPMPLPQCPKCGHVIAEKDHIRQLSADPDRVTEGDGDRYIGYESIGEAYSGGRRHIIEGRDAALATCIAEVTGRGTFLDLGCGDGCLTVPCARLGVHVIAGDISNTMLRILQEKAACNGISLETVILCRMNALEIPLTDASVDCVVANSVLHLISNPTKVLSEIHRVLKPNGCFLCVDDAPGKVENRDANAQYLEIVNALTSLYWDEMRALGIKPQKYSWRFDRDAACEALFGARETRTLPRGEPVSTPLSEGFLPRFAGRGFSDQIDVPEAVHRAVYERVLRRCRERYGEAFDTACYHGTEPDLLVTLYRK